MVALVEVVVLLKIVLLLIQLGQVILLQLVLHKDKMEDQFL